MEHIGIYMVYMQYVNMHIDVKGVGASTCGCSACSSGGTRCVTALLEASSRRSSDKEEMQIHE